MTTPINVLFSASDIEASKQEFITNSSLPAGTTKKFYANYEKYMQANGRNYLDPEMSLSNVFRRLIAYENYLYMNMDLYTIRTKHNQLVTVEDTESFRTRAAEILLPYKTLKGMTASQKFAIAATQEQGLILVPNAPNITNALNVCYDLYDEDEHILDPLPMKTKLEELIAEFDFSPYKAVVETFRYSPSTYSAQYRPFFRANNITTWDQAYEFVKTYYAIGQYRTFWSQSKNSSRYSGRVREFQEFMQRFTENVAGSAPYKSMGQILLFIQKHPKRSDVIFELTSAWPKQAHMYYATLSQLDMDTLDHTFAEFEEDPDKLTEFLRDVLAHMKQAKYDPDQFTLIGRDPISEVRLKEKQKEERLKQEKINKLSEQKTDQEEKKGTPKVTDSDINVEPTPEEVFSYVNSIFAEDQQPNYSDSSIEKDGPTVTQEQQTLQTQEELAPSVETPTIDPQLSESMASRLKSANARISSLTTEYDKKKKEMQELWIQIQEQEVLAKFFSSYLPEDQQK